ncbi:MAG: IPTL-CTERM sorting domain-containing protein [Phycisphaerae bacterium]
MMKRFPGMMGVFFLAGGLPAALPAVSQAGGLQGSWSQLAPYPTNITNNAVTSVCQGGSCTIYSFMGMTQPNNTASVTAASYKLESPGTGPWIQIADAPLLNGKAKIAASAVVCGGNIYLLGGYTIGGPEVTEPRLFRYDNATDTYIQLADVPTEVDDTVTAVYQDRYIYLMSGWHGPINSNTQAVQVYDTQTDTWQQATPIPVAGRFGHTGGAVGDRLVFIDGSIAAGQFPIVHTTVVGTIDPADVAAINWTIPAPSPFSQTYRAAGSQGTQPCDRVIFVGGTNNPYNFNGTGYNGQPANPLDQVMTYDPVADAWSLVDDSFGVAHGPTMDHRGLVYFNGAWVTVGGMRGPNIPTNAVNALTIDGLCASAAIPTTSEWGVVIMVLLMLVVAGRTVLHPRHN